MIYHLNNEVFFTIKPDIDILETKEEIHKAFQITAENIGRIKHDCYTFNDISYEIEKLYHKYYRENDINTTPEKYTIYIINYLNEL